MHLILCTLNDSQHSLILATFVPLLRDCVCVCLCVLRANSVQTAHVICDTTWLQQKAKRAEELKCVCDLKSHYPERITMLKQSQIFTQTTATSITYNMRANNLLFFILITSSDCQIQIDFCLTKIHRKPFQIVYLFIFIKNKHHKFYDFSFYLSSNTCSVFLSLSMDCFL